jgi:hypothetical protein
MQTWFLADGQMLRLSYEGWPVSDGTPGADPNHLFHPGFKNHREPCWWSEAEIEEKMYRDDLFTVGSA